MYIKFTYLTLVQIDPPFVCSLSSLALCGFPFLHALLYMNISSITTTATTPTLRSWAYHL